MDDTSAPPSKRLKTAEEENNDGTDDDAAIEATVVVDTTTALAIMTEKLIALAENQEKLLAENAELVSQVKALTNEVKSLKQGLATVNQTLLMADRGQQRLKAASVMPSLPAVSSTVKEEDNHYTLDTATTGETPCKNLKGSDNNLYLIDILLSLRQYRCINVDKISKSNYPRDIVRHSGNTSYVKYCLELVEFVAANNAGLTDCIRSLADTAEQNEEVVKNVAEILTNACAEKIEEFDNKKVRKKTAIGFGSRIREYKKKIAQLMGVLHPDQGQFTAENVELMEREEFDSMLANAGKDETENEEGV